MERDIFYSFKTNLSQTTWKSPHVIRQQKIERFGITVIRFEDTRLKRDMDGGLSKPRWQVHELEK